MRIRSDVGILPAKKVKGFQCWQATLETGDGRLMKISLPFLYLEYEIKKEILDEYKYILEENNISFHIPEDEKTS